MARICGNYVDDDSVTLGGCGCFCIVFITSVILFAVAFGTLHPLEVGIRYNNNKVYNNGRYFIGIGVWFITYPIDIHVIDFSAAFPLQVWSKEKQSLLIDLSFSYRLDRNKIIDIYRKFDHNYADIYTQVAVATLKDVCSQYETTDFFTKRREIGARMKIVLRDRLKLEHATVEFLNMRGISVPAGFEAKIVQKVVKAQEQKTAEEVRLTSVLRAKIDVIQATGDAQINYTLAQAQANEMRTIQNAQALAQFRLRTQEAESYKELQQALGLSGEGVLKYRWAQIADKLEEENVSPRKLQFVMGFQSAAMQVST